MVKILWKKILNPKRMGFGFLEECSWDFRNAGKEVKISPMDFKRRAFRILGPNLSLLELKRSLIGLSDLMGCISKRERGIYFYRLEKGLKGKNFLNIRI